MLGICWGIHTAAIPARDRLGTEILLCLSYSLTKPQNYQQSEQKLPKRLEEVQAGDRCLPSSSHGYLDDREFSYIRGSAVMLVWRHEDRALRIR